MKPDPPTQEDGGRPAPLEGPPQALQAERGTVVRPGRARQDLPRMVVMGEAGFEPANS